MESSKFAWSKKENPQGKLFKFRFGTQRRSHTLCYGAVRDGKHTKSVAKFQLKVYIHFQIDVFLGVAVLTAIGHKYYHVFERCARLFARLGDFYAQFWLCKAIVRVIVTFYIPFDISSDLYVVYNKNSFKMILNCFLFTGTEQRLDVEGSVELVWKSLCRENSRMKLKDPCRAGAISQSGNEGKVHYKNIKSMPLFHRDDYIVIINKKESIFLRSLPLCRLLRSKPIQVVLGNFFGAAF